MGLRFYRRVHLAPGLSVNLSRSGPSLTMGLRGAHVTVGRRGVTRTIGLPGTGVFYTNRSGHHSGAHSALATAPSSSERDFLRGSVGVLLAAAIIAIVLVGLVILLLR